MLSKIKAWIGVDPGATGAMVVLDDFGHPVYLDWVDEILMYKMLLFYQDCYDIKMVVLEKLWARKGNASKSSTTFQQHVGALRAVIKLTGLPLIEATPQQWMHRRVVAKKNRADKPSVPYVEARYPGFNVRGPKGGAKDGRADALCMAEYAREQFQKGALDGRGVQ